MTRKLALAAVAALTASMLALGPAGATHNDPADPPAPGAPKPAEPAPRTDAPDASCTVGGQVTLAPGLNAEPSQSFFEFIDTAIICTSEDPRLNQTFTVDAQGWTDGDEADNPVAPVLGYGKPGEDCTQGYTAQPADMRAVAPTGDFRGHVEFVRTFGTVHVWGTVSNSSLSFDIDAQVTVTPTDPAELINACAVVNNGMGHPLSAPRGAVTAGVVGGEARLYLS